MTRVLIVDDDAGLVELLGQFLAGEGFEVTSERDGERGARAAIERAPDLVILDVMLPGLNGFEALRRIRESSAVPVVMLSARGEEVDRVVGLELGADDYLAKPFDLPERTWEAFWPQVRARLAVADPGSRPGWQRLWVGGERHRLVLAPALAAVALAVLAVLAPWQRAPRAPSLPGAPTGPAPVTVALDPAALDHVVIQSIETADPETPVMVYSSPDSDVTVLWVFGLERTGV